MARLILSSGLIAVATLLLHPGAEAAAIRGQASVLLVEDNYEYNTRWGTNGGTCRCPNGKDYQVSDNDNNCATLRCEGGTKVNCNKRAGSWSHHSVTYGALIKKGDKGDKGDQGAPGAPGQVGTVGPQGD